MEWKIMRDLNVRNFEEIKRLADIKAEWRANRS